MSDVFGYDEAVADSAHADLQGVISGVNTSLDDLSGYVSSVKANWDADEMELYSGVQARWDSAAGTVRQILDAVQQALGTTTGSVRDMRSQVRSTLQKN